MIATSESFASVESVRRGDNWLCYLPMGWVGDSMFSLSTSLVVGATCNCPESPETVQRDLRELGPSALLAPPRIWENMLTGLQVKAADASWLKRRMYEYFRAVAERRELLKGDGKPIPFATRLALPAGRGAGVRSCARPARSAQCALVPDRRRAAGRRHVPLLPLHSAST